MKTVDILITVYDDDNEPYEEPRQLEQLKLLRMLPSKQVPGDLIPGIVDNAMDLLRHSLIKFYSKHRN